MKITRVVGMAAVWFGVCGLGVAAGQAAKRPMTFQDLMAMKRVSDPQISPSGKWVMFSVTDVSLEKNTKVNHLWVVPLGGSGGTNRNAGVSPLRPSASGRDDASNEGGGERQITFGAGESFGRFSPDGKKVSYTSGDQIAIENWNEADGTLGSGHAHLVVHVTNVEGGADGAIWSPDSKRLMFVASVWPECSVKGGDADGSGSNPPKQSLDGAPGFGAVVGGTRDVAWWKGAEPVGWAEEDACDKAKNAAADKSPVKGQVWDGLLYRHWEHLTGAQRSHVLVVDADSGRNLRDLTPASVVGDAETPTFFVGGAQNYAWAPDSKEIAYVTNLDPVPAASTNNDVFTLRLDEPGAKAVKVSTSPGSDDAPAYSPDGKWLAFRSQARVGFESDKFRLMLMDRGTKAIRNLMPKFDNWADEFVWVPDSAAIVFASGSEGKESVYSYNVLRDEKPGDHPVFVGLTAQGEYSDLRVWQKEVGSGDVQIVASKMTVSSPAEIVAFNGGMLGHTFYDVTDLKLDGYVDPKVSGELIEPEGAGAKYEAPLTHMNDSVLAGLALPSLGYFWFSGAGDTKVQAFMLKPPGFDPAKKYPVKFLMHGGPQTAWGDAWSFRWNWELMAANGYVVIGINRRGSTGYGQKFVDEVSGDWGGRAYEDLMKGLDYAETKFPFIDQTRECALGASYGGFMADWVLTHTNRFKCIVTHDGMYDPVSAYGTTEELWFNEWEFRRPEDFPKGWDGFSASYKPVGPIPPKRSLDRAPGTKTNAGVSPLRPSASGRDDDGLGGARSGRDNDSVGSGRPAQPWRYAGLTADQDPFRKWAPVRFIQNAKTPTLVIHSQKDYRLDVSQGFEMFTALQRLGVPSKMLYFPDESHWVLKPQDSQVWNEVVGDWCDRWTKSGKYAEK